MTDANIEKVRQLVCSNRRLTICVIGNEVGMDKETVCTILMDALGMQKVCAKMVPRLLAEEQKVQQLNACQDIFQQLEADDKLLENVITVDESWVFNMIQKKIRQSCQWKSASSPRPKKAHMQCLQVKVMLITFFDHYGLVHHEFVPQGQTGNQNAPARTAFSVKQLLVSKEITTLHHPS